MSSSKTVILLNFNEREGVAPSDAARGLGDLGGDPSSTPALGEPTVVQGRFGNARSFDGTQGLVGTELTADQTKLRRTMAIEAICDLANVKDADGTYTVIARGKGGSAAERRLWGLQIVTAAGAVSVQMFWERSDGTAATVPGVEFTVPAGWVYLAAVRRWVSESDVEVEYFVNGLSIGTITSAHGDIADGDGGSVTVGCRGDGAGNYQNFFDGPIDFLRVTRGEKVAEEIRHTYDCLLVFPGWGYDLVKAFVPPGQSYSPNPDSVIQRELMIEGDALGEAWAHLEELHRYALPDQAWRTLARWESILRLNPGPRDTTAQRRLRVLGHLRRIQGFSVGEIVNAVAELLDLTADQVEVLEASQFFLDTFDTAISELRWLDEPGNGAAATVSAGHAVLNLTGGNDHNWGSVTNNAPRLRLEVPHATGLELIAKVDPADLVEDTLSATVFVRGGTLQREALLWGIRRQSGANQFFHRKIQRGVAVDTSFGTTVPGSAFWLRYLEASGNAKLYYSTTGVDGPWTLVTTTTTIASVVHAGIAASAGTPSANRTIRFDEFRMWTPNSDHVFQWYIYRDPAFAGEPDIKGAQRVIDGMKPAHTTGNVCEIEALVVDDDNSLCDRDPIGG